MTNLNINGKVLNKIARNYRAEDFNHEYCAVEIENIRRGKLQTYNTIYNQEVLRTMKESDQNFEIQSALQGDDEIKYLTLRN